MPCDKAMTFRVGFSKGCGRKEWGTPSLSLFWMARKANQICCVFRQSVTSAISQMGSLS